MSNPSVPTKNTGDRFTASECNAIVQAFATKAEATDLDAKANQSDLDSVVSSIASKADQSDVDTLATEITSKQASLGFAPENSANKGQVNGYAGLDNTGKVPSAQLPTVSGGSSQVTKTFNPAIVFDVPDQYMKTLQTGDIAITLASSGNIENSKAHVSINPDGVHALSISSDFFVQGVLVNNQWNDLYFYYGQSGQPPQVVIKNTPRLTVLATPSSFTASVNHLIVTLNWNTVTNATRYMVERSTASDFSANLKTIYIGVPNTYIDTDAALVGLTQYWYRVTAVAYGYTNSVPASLTATTGTDASGERSYNITSANQNITVAGDSAFDFSNSGNDKPFSIMFRVKIVNGQSAYIARNNGSSRIWTCGVNAINIVQFAVLDSSVHYVFCTADTGFTPGGWQHVAVTYDGSKTSAGVLIYINGVSAKNGTQGSGYAGMSSGGVMTIGADLAQSIQSNGLLDNLAIANRVLTQSEITAAYNGNVSIDFSTLSFFSALIGYWKFDANLNDSSSGGTHTGTATSPLYSTDV